MKRIYILMLSLLFSFAANAQDRTRNLAMKTHIDSVYVFGFDLTESRSAKGGIWNTKTGKPANTGSTPRSRWRSWTGGFKENPASLENMRIFVSEIANSHSYGR